MSYNGPLLKKTLSPNKLPSIWSKSLTRGQHLYKLEFQCFEIKPSRNKMTV